MHFFPWFMKSRLLFSRLMAPEKEVKSVIKSEWVFGARRRQGAATGQTGRYREKGVSVLRRALLQFAGPSINVEDMVFFYQNLYDLLWEKLFYWSRICNLGNKLFGYYLFSFWLPRPSIKALLPTTLQPRRFTDLVMTLFNISFYFYKFSQVFSKGQQFFISGFPKVHLVLTRTCEFT